MTSLDMNKLSNVNAARCESPTGFNHPMEEWSIAEWTNAICGEAGEAANLAKKIIRTRAGVRGNSGTKEQYEAELAKELADIVLYCDLTATKLGIDLWSTDGAVAKKFNEVSDKIGSELKL